MTLLAGGHLADGTAADIRIHGDQITEVGPRLEPRGDEVVDCTGMVVLDAPVEPHAHIDKAGTFGIAPNPAGDLPNAVAAWRDVLAPRPAAEVLAGARRALEDLLAHGATAVRSHVNVGAASGLAPLEAVLELREQSRALVDLQVVVLPSSPLTGPAGATSRALLKEGLAMGADLCGGAPYTDPDPIGCTEYLVDVAVRHGVPLDLHTDEVLDPSSLHVRHLARLRPPAGTTASHCVSLGILPVTAQEAVAAELAEAGIAVIALPHTNLYLQARGVTSAPPRGLTAVRALLDAGVTVAAGGDNVRDPFNAVGRADPLETAALMVLAAHLTPAEAWHAVGAAGRATMGLAPVRVAAGFPAELLCVEGDDLADALGRAGERRTVVHHGRVVARVSVERCLLP
ncbi:MAG: hypothetical protein JWN29_3890 [Acidimicrobiales bacterium]|nr:hypothetical protein [Acidimicrobiales bacterium]